MTKTVIALAWLAGAACGRIRFDPLGVTGDGRVGDGVFLDVASGDGGPQPVSCAGLAATCGPTGTTSCCDSPPVPGGTFYRSYDVGTDGMYPDMGYPATVSSFRLDAFEVTVGRFRQLVNAGMDTQSTAPAAGAGAHAQIANSGWDPSWDALLPANTAALEAAFACDVDAVWTAAPGANESLPMNCVNWYDAMAFCAWDGGFLPTEAEWNYAASGGDQQRAYPWSNPPSDLTAGCANANFDPGTDCVDPPNGAPNRVGSESPAGDGRWGQADLGGNMWEWTLDWYTTPYPNTTCNDCANLSTASDRVRRGGGFFETAADLRGAYRSGNDTPANRTENVGFRCARAP